MLVREGLWLESELFSNSVGGMRGRGDHELQDGGDGGDRDSGRGCIVSAHTCTLTPTHLHTHTYTHACHTYTHIHAQLHITHMHTDTYQRSGNFHSKNISSLDSSAL